MIEAKGALYDPRVLSRILLGKDLDAAYYIGLMSARAALVRSVASVSRRYDALVMPTVPMVAPPLAALAEEDTYRSTNVKMLRNPMLANLIDRCAISIPCHDAGEAPVGLMLVGEHGEDRRLFAIAAAVEAVVSPVVGSTEQTGDLMQ
jgi:aspartyl-tRNA(Asn)/glutamyl-tRNA(Gln) amidotransferase subunit A